MAELKQQAKKLLRHLPPILKETAEEIPTIFLGYLKEGFEFQNVLDAYKRGETDVGVKKSKTLPNKLRTVSGNLYRSFIRGQDGSLTESQTKDNKLKVTIGSKLPYAAIHNYGGTIKHPGGTPYITIPHAVFISKDKASELKGRGMTIKYTKPHDIKIPARRYFTKAEEKFKTKGWDIILNDMYRKILKFWNN